MTNAKRAALSSLSDTQKTREKPYHGILRRFRS